MLCNRSTALRSDYASGKWYHSNKYYLSRRSQYIVPLGSWQFGYGQIATIIHVTLVAFQDCYTGIFNIESIILPGS